MNNYFMAPNSTIQKAFSHQEPPDYEAPTPVSMTQQRGAHSVRGRPSRLLLAAA